jgi:hypothetical protein
MNIAEMFSNFYAAFAIFALVAIGFFVFVTVHPHSKAAKDAIFSHLKGCTIDAVLWIVIVGIAIILGEQNVQLENVFEQVIGTKILSVPLITWSMIFVPLTFSIHKAYGGFDYRLPAIGIFLLIAFIYAIYYLIT